MKKITHTDWVNIDNDFVFTQIHVPNSKVALNKAVIIVGPLGPEYMFCHRSIKSLAERIASLGLYSLRYDHIGMGNSSSDLFDTNIVSKWNATLPVLKEHLKHFYSIDDVIYISLRTGSLILSEYLNKYESVHAIFWFPYVLGKAWVRDMRMMDSKRNNVNKSSTTIDAAGYPLTFEAQEEINQVNLLDNNLNVSGNILLIEDSLSLPNKKLANYFNEFTETDIKSTPGMKEMLTVVSSSVVPLLSLDTICQWLDTLRNETEKITCPECEAPLGTYQDDFFKESIHNLNGKKNLFGIISEPLSCNYDDIVLIVNAGSGHHVGPNRLNVDLARYLASVNIASFRFDLGHLGESIHGDETSKLNPFVASTNNDIQYVIEYITGKYKKNIILLGLCSGAHNQFHAALNTTSKFIKQLIVINPINFYYKDGQSLEASEVAELQVAEENYNKNVFSFNKWMSLISNPRKLIKVVNSVFIILLSKLSNLKQNLLFKLGGSPQQQLDKDMLSLVKKGINIAIINSEGDPGHKILINEAPVFVRKFQASQKLLVKKIQSSDHNFTTRNSKNELFRVISEVIK